MNKLEESHKISSCLNLILLCYFVLSLPHKINYFSYVEEMKENHYGE